ncbi:MAG: hypothetical protein ACI9HK_001643 [Pirellulaceae bacterium]|jgi:hypothetical protein
MEQTETLSCGKMTYLVYQRPVEIATEIRFRDVAGHDTDAILSNP